RPCWPPNSTPCGLASTTVILVPPESASDSVTDTQLSASPTPASTSFSSGRLVTRRPRYSAGCPPADTAEIEECGSPVLLDNRVIVPRPRKNRGYSSGWPRTSHSAEHGWSATTSTVT